jgi:clostripain
MDPTSMTAADFGRLVVEEGERGRASFLEAHPEDAERVRYESASAYDLGAAAAVKRAVDALAVSLAEASAKDVFEELRGPGPRGTTLNYVRDDLLELPYVDLHALATRAAECDDLAAPARERARAVAEAVDAFVIASFGMDGLAGFQPGKSGVFIVFPDGDVMRPTRAGQTKNWQRCSWYSPLASTDEHYRRWAWCSDGAREGNGAVENWYELLDAWFDVPDGGGCNGYAW